MRCGWRGGTSPRARHFVPDPLLSAPRLSRRRSLPSGCVPGPTRNLTDCDGPGIGSDRHGARIASRPGSPVPGPTLSDESIVLRSEAERTFLAKLAWIDRAALTLGSRHGFDPDEQDDFAATVREKLIDDDYAAIRKHRGEATLETYLTIVIANHFKDYCVHRWGRWRPSAVARRAGNTAVRLEVLIHRDGHRLDSAIEVLRSEGVTLPASELRRLAVSFPARTNPRKAEQWIPLDAISPDGADDHLMETERQKTLDRALETVSRAMARLSPTDQILLRLRIWEGMAVADIARSLNMDQKPLYRRIERSYKELREHVEAEGVDVDDVRSLLDDP